VAKQWFGYTVPDHVTHIQILFHPEIDGRMVYWKNKDGGFHQTPFETNQETVEAVLIAMKLS
jgi:hypothetical protein